MRNVSISFFIFSVVLTSAALADTNNSTRGTGDSTVSDTSNAPTTTQELIPILQVDTSTPTAPFPKSVPETPALQPRSGIDVMTQDQWNTYQKAHLSTSGVTTNTPVSDTAIVSKKATVSTYNASAINPSISNQSPTVSTVPVPSEKPIAHNQPNPGIDIMTQDQWNAYQRAHAGGSNTPANTPAPVKASASTQSAPISTVPAYSEPIVPSQPTIPSGSEMAASPPGTAAAALNIANVAPSIFSPNGYVEAGGDYHSITHNFGDWYGEYVRGEVQTGADDRWNAEILNQREFKTEGVYGDVGNTHVFNEDWYSAITVGGGEGAFFLPQYRADAFLNRKWLDQRQLITTLGIGADGFKDGHKDESVFFGATYYFTALWNIQGGVRVNDSTPGSVFSASEFVAVTEGRAQEHFITLRYGFGKEAYQIIGPGAGNAISDFYSQQLSLELRQWLGKDWGFDVRGEKYHNPNYDRTGVNLGFFKEF